MMDALVKKYGPEPDAGGAGDNTPPPVASPTTAGGASPTGDHRARLVQFYTAHNPEKLGTVDATLEKFKGREEEMFKALTDKYNKGGGGGSPASPTTAASPTAGGNTDYRARLVRFYSKWNPEKVSSVDATLEKFKGREAELIKTLVTKYGAEPAADNGGGGGDAATTTTPASPGGSSAGLAAAPPAAASGDTSSTASSATGPIAATDYRARLVRFYSKWNPEKLNSVDQTLAKFAGREEEAMRALISKYGPEPEGDAAQPASSSSSSAGGGDFKSRLVRFYEKYNKEKIGTVDATLEKFKGRESELISALVTKYGPEPGSSPASASLAPAPTAPPPAGDYKSRLTSFYNKWAPEKLPKVGDHLTKWAGREEEFFDALQKKYGPEPAPSSSSGTPQQGALGKPPQQQQQQQDSKTRLIAFYTKHAPEKLPKVDDHLTKWAGRFDEFMGALVSKYGAEPAPSATPKNDSLAATTTATTKEPPSFKKRLTAFYTQYAPEKLPKVDDHIKKYEARVEEFMKALVTKHGPEPKPSPSPSQSSMSPPPTAAREDEGSSAGAAAGDQQDRKLVTKPTGPPVDPYKAVIAQQLSMLSPEAASQIGGLAENPAFINLVKNVTNTLAGGAVSANAESRIRALCEEEADARENIGSVETDEYGILGHLSATSHNKITSSEESATLQRKSHEALRASYFKLWTTFAENKLKLRKREAASMLTPYQRVAFSKSRAGMQSFQRDVALSPPSNNNNNNGPASPQSASRSASRQQASASATNRSASQNVSMSRLVHASNSRELQHNLNSSGMFHTNSSPLVGASGIPQLDLSSTRRGASAGGRSPRGGAATPRLNLSSASSPAGLNISAAPTPRQQVSSARIGSQPPTGRNNTNRMQLVKNRHAVETRVEKLSDVQLKSLHRRLEKWGLPVPTFFNSVVKSRGIATSNLEASSRTTNRADPMAGVNASSAADRNADTSVELDATVQRVLSNMDAAGTW